MWLSSLWTSVIGSSQTKVRDMDYDTVISSAETTIGMVEAIRRSLAEQAGGFQPFHIFQPVAHNCMALRPRIVVWTCQAGIQPDQIRVRLSKTPLTACRSYGLYSYWLFPERVAWWPMARATGDIGTWECESEDIVRGSRVALPLLEMKARTIPHFKFIIATEFHHVYYIAIYKSSINGIMIKWY